jgi:hypothetical protein
MMHIKNLITTAPIPGSDNWHTTMLTIDPESATELLQGNTGNRRLSPGAVARYAAAMRKGDWKTSPEPLIFAPTGRLMNGQTRLHAVKATGIPQKFMCVFGVEESVFSVLDRGRPRTMADAHQMDRETAEVVRLLTRLAYPQTTGGSAIADSDFLKVARVVGNYQKDIRDACPSKARYFGAAPFRTGAVARILSGENVEHVTTLYRNLNLGNVDDLPPIGSVAVKMVVTGKWHMAGGEAGARDGIARAWRVFSAQHAEKTAIPRVDTNEVLAEVRARVLTAVQDAANV